ncbi:MAG: glycosyltransferase family 2 protein [Planctomycetota bacterium]
MARVFVGVPTWNRPVWVREAVESVRAQTLRDVRVVVSDNASEPEVRAEVAAWVRSLDDPRVEFHQQEVNEGEYGQARYFASAVREPYFAMLHDDDRMEPNHLANALERLEPDPSLLCFFANSYIFDEEGERWPAMMRRMRRHQSRERLADGPVEMRGPLMRCGLVPISGTVFPTRRIRETRFGEGGTGCYPFEFDVLLRICEDGGNAWYSREESIGFRFHRNAMRNYLDSWSNPDVVRRFIDILERRHFDGRDERTRRWLVATMLAFDARIRMRAGDRAGGRASLARGVRSHPFARRLWTVALPSLLGFDRRRAARAAS